MKSVSSRRSICLDGYEYASANSYFITICTQHKEHRFGHIADGIMWLNTAGAMIAERIQAIAVKFPGTLIDSYVIMPNHIHFILTLLGYQPNGEHIPNGRHVGAAPRGRPLSDRQGRPGTLPSNGDALNPERFTTIPDKSDWLSLSGPVGPKAGGHEGPPLHINDPGGNATYSNDAGDNNVPDRIRNVPSVAEVMGWFKASTTNYYINGVKAGTYPAFDRRLWQRNYYEHIIRTETAYNQIDEYIRTNPLCWTEDRLR